MHFIKQLMMLFVLLPLIGFTHNAYAAPLLAEHGGRGGSDFHQPESFQHHQENFQHRDGDFQHRDGDFRHYDQSGRDDARRFDRHQDVHSFESGYERGELNTLNNEFQDNGSVYVIPETQNEINAVDPSEDSDF